MEQPTKKLDYFATLEVPSDATASEITAAYDRLQGLYRAERFADGPPEFAAQAAAKRAQLDAAYRALVQPTAQQPTQRSDAVDFRPLPPARRQERTAGEQIDQPIARPKAPARRLPVPVSVGLLVALIALVFLGVSLPGVRTSNSQTALATPTLAEIQLPYTDAELEALRQAAESGNTPDDWAKYANALFDVQETLREQAPSSAQYQTTLSRWLDAEQAYRKVLAVRDDPVLRSDLALTLAYYSVAMGDQARGTESLAQAQQAYAAAPDEPRVLLNYGLALVAANPPQTAPAVMAWRKLATQSPDSQEGQLASLLIAQYSR